jgi:hypothetical protein
MTCLFWSPGGRVTHTKGPNRIDVSPTHLSKETDPISETVCSPIFRILHDGKNQKKRAEILSSID